MAESQNQKKISPASPDSKAAVNEINRMQLEERVTSLVAASMPQFGRDYTYFIDPEDGHIVFKALNDFGMHFIKHVHTVADNSKPFIEEHYERTRRERIHAARGAAENMDGQPSKLSGDGRVGTRNPDDAG